MTTLAPFVSILAVALALSGCNVSIEDEARAGIRKVAAGALDRFEQAIDRAGSAEKLEQILLRELPTLYAFAWDDDMEPVADVYHIYYASRGSGLFAEDYQVKACVRYSVEAGERQMKSVDLAYWADARAPQSCGWFPEWEPTGLMR
ncbi:hypothetical protein M1E17_02955 [Arthrobacter sp. D1-29]